MESPDGRPAPADRLPLKPGDSISTSLRLLFRLHRFHHLLRDTG